MGNKPSIEGAPLDDEGLILYIDCLGIWIRYTNLQVNSREDKIVAAMRHITDHFLDNFHLKGENFSEIRHILVKKLSVPEEREDLVATIRREASYAKDVIIRAYTEVLISLPDQSSRDIDKELEVALAEM